MARLKEHKYSRRIEYYTEVDTLEKAREIQGGSKELCALHGDIDLYIAKTGRKFDINGFNHKEALKYIDPVVMAFHDTRHSIYELKEEIANGRISDSYAINAKLDSMIGTLNTILKYTKEGVREICQY